MKIPPGKTEGEVLAAIERTVNLLAPSFVFGFYDVDDIKQQGRMFALELLEKGTYDPGRELANYLYTHVHNRLCNFKRDRLRRNDPPCPKCAAGEFCTPAGPCDKQSAWDRRNAAKANLMRPLDLTQVTDERAAAARRVPDVSQEAEVSELLERVDAELPVELRQVYLQMRAGVTVPRTKRAQVEAAVKAILKGELGCPGEDE